MASRIKARLHYPYIAMSVYAVLRDCFVEPFVGLDYEVLKQQTGILL